MSEKAAIARRRAWALWSYHRASPEARESIAEKLTPEQRKFLRTQLGHIGKSYSTDGGDTWSEMESLGVRAPEAPATLRRIPSTGDLLLIWNDTFTPGAGHGGRRTPLTAALSPDDGRTWRTVDRLESDPRRTYSYTSLVFVRDRAVMSYWESSPTGRHLSCRFRSLPVGRLHR